MTKQFDLEQQILACWNIVDDINLLYGLVLDGDATTDNIANILLGMKELYAIKFNKCFNTFEELLEENYNERIQREQFNNECG